jgi:hypothetical protein
MRTFERFLSSTVLPVAYSAAMSVRLGLAMFLLCGLVHAKGAMDAVAVDLAKDLASVPKGALVVAAPLTTDVPCTKSDELVRRLATSVAGRLTDAEVHPAPMALGGASRVAAKYPALVYVSVELKKGALLVTVDAQLPVKNSWDRLRRLLPPPIAHAFAQRPVDAEVQSFLAPIVLEQAKVTKFTHTEGAVLAAACGDIDGDGGLEVALSTRDRVSLGRFHGKAFRADRSAFWADLGKRVPVPMRDPLHRLVIGPQVLAAGNTSYGSFELTSRLEKVAASPWMPLWWDEGFLCSAAVPEQGVLDSAVRVCQTGGMVDAGKNLPAAQFDNGGLWADESPVYFTHDASSKLKLRRGAALQVFENMNAQAIVADMDLDGIPELVATSGTSPESILVYSWKSQSVTEKKKLTTTSPVLALAACPPEEGGKPGFLAVFGSEVWLVR